MAGYRHVDDLSHLPVHRDQLRAQRSVTSMGSLYLLPLYLEARWRCSDIVLRWMNWVKGVFIVLAVLSSMTYVKCVFAIPTVCNTMTWTSGCVWTSREWRNSSMSTRWCGEDCSALTMQLRRLACLDDNDVNQCNSAVLVECLFWRQFVRTW